MTEWIGLHGGLSELGVFVARGVLVLFSLVSIAVMAERLLVLRSVGRMELRDHRSLRAALRGGDAESVRSCAAASESPVAAALQAGIENADLGEAKMGEAIDQEVSMQNAELGRNLPILATIASVAPYVGLFGTVLGILNAFGRIAQTGQTGAKVVAGPIAEALTATAMGLGVAIPAVMAYNYFSGRVNVLGLAVEDHTLELAARLPQIGLGTVEASGVQQHENR